MIAMSGNEVRTLNQQENAVSKPIGRWFPQCGRR
jgi:hypothetical protein